MEHGIDEKNSMNLSQVPHVTIIRRGRRGKREGGRKGGREGGSVCVSE